MTPLFYKDEIVMYTGNWYTGKKDLLCVILVAQHYGRTVGFQQSLRILYNHKFQLTYNNLPFPNLEYNRKVIQKSATFFCIHCIFN